MTLYVNEEQAKDLKALSQDLDQLLIVSHLDLVTTPAPDHALVLDDYAVSVSRAQGYVCERCRAVRPEVGTIAEAPTLCHRCHQIVKTHYPAYFEAE